MNGQDWPKLVEQLRGVDYQFGLIRLETPVYRVEFETGLSDGEVASVESRFGFRFPPDLRGFLQTVLPKGPRFPEWRGGDEAALREWLNQPRDGVLFDIEYNRFWLEEWGPRPELMSEALGVGEALLAAAPRLIPVYGHRMMPDEPHLPGNPVFSVHQTDIIHYGFDLEDYFRHEFKLPGREPRDEPPRSIRFWEIERFQGVRWGGDGRCAFDNRRGQLP